jgi:hypothetical protein
MDLSGSTFANPLPVNRLTGNRDFWMAGALALFTLFAFYFSVQGNQKDFDYTQRIAGALLEGHVGLAQTPPSWLNEMVPQNNQYYSVFPLGAVISVLPVAVLQKWKIVTTPPARAVAAIIAALIVWFLFRLTAADEQNSGPRRALLSLAMVFGTWTWANLGFAGAWQLALGLAVLGEVGALYFVLVDFRPLLAGAFFALGWGNRTEVVLCFPIFVYFIVRHLAPASTNLKGVIQKCRANLPVFIYFIAVSVVLGVLTAAYNYVRFGSFFDFGYSHIPNVLKEPWYQHGLFSLYAIRWNIYKMLFEGVGDVPVFPYLQFGAFGCSIFIASPFLFLLFREGGRFKVAAWIAIGLLVCLLWMHGNPGGWQFSYRYGMVLLPWMFLIILGNGPRKITVNEVSLVVVSIAMNAIATYLFLWTNRIHP